MSAKSSACALSAVKYMQKVLSGPSQAFLAEQLISIITNTDITVLGEVLQAFITKTGEFGNAKMQQNIRNVVRSLLLHFKGEEGFRDVIVRLFKGLPEFPEQFLNLIPKDCACLLVVYGFSADMKTQRLCLRYLEERIFPCFKEVPDFYVEGDVLYELCSLGIPSFNPGNLFDRSCSPDLLLFKTKFGSNEIIDCRLDIESVDVAVADIVADSDLSRVLTEDGLMQLSKFFPVVDANWAGELLLGVLSPACESAKPWRTHESELIRVFDVFKNVFRHLNLNMSSILHAIDNVNAPHLSDQSVGILVKLLSHCFVGQLMPSYEFARRWENEELQRSVLKIVSTVEISNLDFAKGSSLLNVRQLELPSNALKPFNNCWLSLDFDKTVVALCRSEKELSQMMERIEQYPALILAIFCHLDGASKSAAVMHVAREALVRMMHSRDGKFGPLFKMSASFMKDSFLSLYEKNPLIIERIREAVGPETQLLCDCLNVGFSLDVALHSGMKVSAFLSSYIAKYSPAIIPEIFGFVMPKVVDKAILSANISDADLNSMFQFFEDNFRSYPPEIGSVIKGNYDFCRRIDRKLKDFTFDVRLPPDKVNEIKQEAEKMFRGLLQGTITADQFASSLESTRSRNPALFSCVVEHLVKEFRYLGRHPDRNIEKLGKLVGTLLLRDVFEARLRDEVIASLIECLRDKTQAAQCRFACLVIEVVVPVLTLFSKAQLKDISRALERVRPDLQKKVLAVVQTVPMSSHLESDMSLVVDPTLSRFRDIPSPPPKICKAAQLLKGDGKGLAEFLRDYPDYADWIAYDMVATTLDQPKQMHQFARQISTVLYFWKRAFQAAVAQAFELILSEKLDKFENAFIRRRLLLLGRFIGRITLGADKPLLARYLDVKKLLAYGLAQGQLYGIVPFVCEIFMEASPIYGIRNPFVASVLELLAGIMKMDCLKLAIKHHIQALFENLQVTMDMFAHIPEAFPRKCKDNFDFILPPFSLRKLAGPDTDRIAMLEENRLSRFIASQVVLAESPHLADPEEYKRVSKGVCCLIAFRFDEHRESSLAKSLAETAESTAIEIISKDFASFQDQNQVMEDAMVMAKQFAAGLTLFTAPAHIARDFRNALKKSYAESLGIGWVDKTAEMNYDWMIQFLRDVVEYRALKAIEAKVKDDISKRRNVAKVSPPALDVYGEMAALSLPQQPFPLLDIQSKDKQIPIDPDLDEYLKRCQSQLSTEAGKSPQEIVAAEFPDFDGEYLKFDRFRSILKTVLQWVVKANQSSYEELAAQVLARLCSFVSQNDIIQAQGDVLLWVRTPLRSCIVIRELLCQHLVTIEQLDRLFTTLLNADPFNTQDTLFIAKFMSYALIDAKLFPADSVLSTLSILSVLSVVKNSALETVTPVLEDLAKKFNELEVPGVMISASSKLRFLSTFDPYEGLTNATDIADIIQRWVKVKNEMPSESALEDITKRCAVYGKHLYSAFFVTESEGECVKFVLCLIEFGVKYEEILDSVIHVITENGFVVPFDLRKCYTILRVLMEHSTDLCAYSTSLHQVRPFLAPSFTVDWMELITDKYLVYGLLRNRTNWGSYLVLMIDFACSLALMNSSEKKQESFSVMYRAFLRHLLVLVHDFTEFCAVVSPVLLSFIPFNFAQLRNVLIFVSEKYQNCFDFTQLSAMLPAKFVASVRQLCLSESYDSSVLSEVLLDMSKERSQAALCYFASMVCQSHWDWKRGDDIEQTTSFGILAEAFRSILVDLADGLVNALVDHVRGKCNETSFYKKLLVALAFPVPISKKDSRKEVIHITPRLTLSELIVRIVIERASTTAPIPSKLGSLVLKLLAKDSPDRSIWNMSFVKNDEKVKAFLENAYAMYRQKSTPPNQ